MRCEREIVGENFEKKKRKQVRETIKKRWKFFLGKIVGEKKDVRRKFRKIAF
jgi:hypothetical protein